MTPDNHALCANGLHFAYAGGSVLRGIDLQIDAGTVTALLGVNGAGKSTLLRLLMGFMRPSQGEVSLAGQALHTWPRRDVARHMAYVPQGHVSPFPYSVREIVLLGRLPHSGLSREPGVEDAREVDAVLQRVGLSALAHRPYTQISGGELQLTLIARALAQGARTLILDEPVSGLDYGNQIRLLVLLRTLAAEGYAVLMSTHHPEHALWGADRVVVLQAGQITADGLPAHILTPSAIHSLYGIQVQALCAANGHAAGFCPL